MKYRNVVFILLMGIFSLTLVQGAGAETAGSENITEIVSDNTWKTTKNEEAWWHSIGFDDSHWTNAASPSSGTCGPNITLNPDIAQPMWDLTPVVGGHAYFRKKFTLNEKPEKAVLKTVFDDDGDIYINSNLIRQDRSGSVNPEPFVDDITRFLDSGDNVIGLYVIDTAGGCQSAQARVDLTLVYDDHILDIPLVKQNDTLWGDDIYAGGSKDKLNCGKDLKSCGCAVTSLSMVLNNLGSHKAPNGEMTTPQTLNEYFKRNQRCSEFGCVSLGYAYGAVRWAAANQYSKESSDNFGTNSIQFVERSKPTIDAIKKNIESDNPVVLQSSDKQHWFVGYGIERNNILIRDPFYDKHSLNDEPYLNNAAAMVRYGKSNSSQSSVQIFGAPGEQILVQDDSGRKTGYDAESGAIAVDIPGSEYYFEPHAGFAGQVATDPHKETGNSGVWTVYISAPDNGQYNVDVTAEQGGNNYEYTVYGTATNGEVNYQIDTGKIARQGEFESSFNFVKNSQKPEDILRLENKKDVDKKQSDKKLVAKKEKNIKEHVKTKTKPNDHRYRRSGKLRREYGKIVRILFVSMLAARGV